MTMALGDGEFADAGDEGAVERAGVVASRRLAYLQGPGTAVLWACHRRVKLKSILTGTGTG
jgi:hypothetical protein